MSEKDQNKLIHDINAAISAVSQAVDLISDNWKENPELVEKMLPLTREKLITLSSDWQEMKEIIKK
ncbi:hypothetical protein A9Q84_19615 [Halobacteriovorax marinus]|uniref:Uncharacterized protein n=1 Tax=Halobacteriovorax marinus TaxID=97084 RepID=A0A1Y5F2P5_9BACT|nr:hypothetical protein A9Q84_19615 [Halobacteriovorax marinus]